MTVTVQRKKALKNAIPKNYRARFIEPGVISYEDSNQGTVLVSKATLDRMAATFRNCPVIFVPEQHDDSDKENSFNFNDASQNPAAGIVTGNPVWGEDGWQYVDFIIWDPDAQAAIKNGYSVSCAYGVDDVGKGGEWHQIPYDEEITNGHYLHMAIVAKPRYEGSKIYANSKGVNIMFGKKPKLNAPEDEKPKDDNKDEGEMVNADEATVSVGGQSVPLSTLVEAYKAKASGDDEGGGQELSPEDEVEIEGVGRVKVADLIAAYSDSEAGDDDDSPPPMGNAEDPTDTTAEPPVDESKQEQQNARKNGVKVVHAGLKNAARTPDGEKPGNGIETESMRLARGKARYSIPVNNNGGGK